MNRCPTVLKNEITVASVCHRNFYTHAACYTGRNDNQQIDSVPQRRVEPVAVGRVLAKSASWMAVACSLALVMPEALEVVGNSCLRESLENACLGYGATRPFQVVVNTKLGMQALTETQRSTSQPFLLREGHAFLHELNKVVHSKDPDRGANWYAFRGALSKSMTLTGYDMAYQAIQAVCPGISPGFTSALSGALSGCLQGAVVAVPEYFSTMQKRFSDQSIIKSNREIIEEIKPYLCKTRGAPILWSMGRNSVFDCIFNVLRTQYQLPFGVSALTAMTGNYVLEKQRSLFQQQEDPEKIKDAFKKRKWFDGWLGKALEFILIFQFLQVLKEIANKQKEPPKSNAVKGDSPCNNPHTTFQPFLLA